MIDLIGLENLFFQLDIIPNFFGESSYEEEKRIKDEIEYQRKLQTIFYLFNLESESEKALINDYIEEINIDLFYSYISKYFDEIDIDLFDFIIENLKSMSIMKSQLDLYKKIFTSIKWYKNNLKMEQEKKVKFQRSLLLLFRI